MKNIIYIVLSLFLISSTVQVATAAHHNVAEQQQSHACPMHPEVTGQNGDTCPKCGMNLEHAHQADGDHCPNKGKCEKCANKAKCDNCKGCKGEGKCNKCANKAKCENCKGCKSEGKCDKCANQAKCENCKGEGKCDKCANKAKSENCKGCKECKGCKGCAKKGDHAHKNYSHKEHASAKHTHACPMNAEITGIAGDTCPNCGMDLMPIKAE
ncbi:hypothetical protein L2737_08690 [Shewanella electrodiphila]|uniref:Heavy metal binding domain-containing protein n=1 Tax=Shewanella electrodiphila TaxID=934143 RepID=A0ABT0KPD3_9GAMM|nr:heavy metal-binding domain-containing protein [Shewanella electrodiphila]MCL1045401.1 hypothetical protein [Shewanella electrodiphila]